MRQCGDCQLCCKLLPMSAAVNAHAQSTVRLMLEHGMIEAIPSMTPDFDKPAATRCPHQQHKVGCRIYDKRPFGCRMWTCGWLHGADLPRPDHAHYVVDTVMDEVKVGNDLIPAVQVWVDRHYLDAHQCPRLRAFLDQQGAALGALTIIRYTESEGFVLIPPSLTKGQGWIERHDSIHQENPGFGIHHRVEQLREEQT